MLEVENIVTFYGEFQVLKKVSLVVESGELVVLLGPNGHGKSTLCKTICGLVKPCSGVIRYKDLDLDNLTTEKIVENGVVYIAEERHLFREMTVLKNLKLGAYNRNARAKEAENLSWVLELFPRLKERSTQLASTLSGGEARMLALARGLMSNARLLVADEPSLGLSPKLRVDVFNIIREVHQLGIDIILVEQNIPQVSELADRVYLMDEGKITFSGNIEDALRNEALKEAFLGM